MPSVLGDPQDVLSVCTVPSRCPGGRGPSLSSKRLALPRPHGAQPVHDEGHVQPGLHPWLGSPSRSWVHFLKDLRCTTAPLPTPQTWGLLGGRAAAPRLGQSGQRSATAPWESQAGGGSGYHGNTLLFLKPRTPTQLTAPPRVRGRVRLCWPNSGPLPAARTHDQNRAFYVVVVFLIFKTSR